MTYNDLSGFSAYVSIDIETTGLESETNEIIEIAALKYTNECIVDEFVTFVSPTVMLSPYITELTGITDEMLAGAPSIDVVIREFVEFIGDFPLVAHNSKFDMSFIQKYCRQFLGSEIQNPVIDTLRLSRELMPRLKNYKLATIKEHLGIHSDALHRAKADAYVCGEIIKKMIAYIKAEQAKRAQQRRETPPVSEQASTPDDRVITVGQLNRYIKTLLESDNKLYNVMVRGEISNYVRHSSGHRYMTLKDEQGAVRAIMFRSDASRLRFEPENGMKVIVKGRISVFERDGQYQLYLSEMQPDGVGDLYVAYEQLKAKLKEEGLFDDKYKKEIPRFPRAVGVVTSPTGAAVRDIINVITRRYPLCEIIVHPAQVQGAGGSRQVAEAIECFNRLKNVDVIIAGRGGGSIEELWVFNEEETARAIFRSDIPIISAVGHETDFTIADFVADLRAPTPSAAAELAVPSVDELKTALKSSLQRMRVTLNGYLENRKNVLKRFALKTPSDYINYNMQRIDMLTSRLTDNISVLLSSAKNRFAVEVGRLNALSPLGVIERGYSVAQDGSGRIIRSVNDVKADDEITTRLSDGTVTSRVSSVISSEKQQA